MTKQHGLKGVASTLEFGKNGLVIDASMGVIDLKQADGSLARAKAAAATEIEEVVNLGQLQTKQDSISAGTAISLDGSTISVNRSAIINPGQGITYDPMTGDLAISEIAISRVTVDTSAADIEAFALASYTGSEYQSGDIVILNSANQTWIHSGGSAGTESDFVQVSADPSDSYVRGLLSAGTGLVYNAATGQFSIADGGVGTAQLADGGVTTAKLADNSVTAAKLGADVAADINSKATQADLTTTNSNVSAVDVRVTTAEGNITNLQSDSAANAAAILSNDGDITALQTSVATKASQADLDTLEAVVADKADIATTNALMAAAQANTADIAENDTAISTLQTDIATKASQAELDAAEAEIATVSALAAKALKEEYAAAAFSDSVVNVGAVIPSGSRVKAAMISISTAFDDPSATVQIGTASNPGAILSASLSDLADAAGTLFQHFVHFVAGADTQVIATVSGGSATAGAIDVSFLYH